MGWVAMGRRSVRALRDKSTSPGMSADTEQDQRLEVPTVRIDRYDHYPDRKPFNC